MSIYFEFQPPKVSHPRYHFEVMPRWAVRKERKDEHAQDPGERTDESQNEGEAES